MTRKMTDEFRRLAAAAGEPADSMILDGHELEIVDAVEIRVGPIVTQFILHPTGSRGAPSENRFEIEHPKAA